MSEMKSSRIGEAVILLVLAGRLGIAAPEEPPTAPEGPVGTTPDSFFQPLTEEEFGRIPPVEGGEEQKSFWEPAGDDFFVDIPRALDSEGNPVEDFDEALWRKEFGKATPEKEEWVQSGGHLEYRGAYSTNIDQSAPGTDVDLRIRPNETEVSDWINTFALGYEYQYEIVPDVLKGAVRYDLSHYNYADESRENATLHLVELATIQRLTESLEWEIYGGVGIDSRQPNAQYNREDFFQWHLGTEFRQEIDEARNLSLGYEYRHRDYETRQGANLLATEITPFYDWAEHHLWSAYSHDLTEHLHLDASLNYSKRDYDSTTLDEFGEPIVGEFRRYDLWEPMVALTSTPTDHTQLTAYYVYDFLSSSGRYYDYDESTFGVLLEQDLCPERVPGLVFKSQFEYANRNYDSQLSRSLLAGGHRSVRDDERITLYFALERTIEDNLTTGIDYYYVDNDSNDDYSRYQEDRYGAYVRYDF